MNEQTNRGLAYDPQDLERLLVSRENVGDVDGMVALYEPQALLDMVEAGCRMVGRKFVSFMVNWLRRGESLSWESSERQSSAEIWRSPRHASRTAP